MPSLSTSLRHGYGVAAFSLAIANTAIMFFLLKFLVDEARLPPATAGNVLLVAKTWDAIVDPIIGRLLDRSGDPPRWIASATLPLAVCFAALWWGLPLVGTAAAIGYGLLLMVYNTAFSAAVIPYGALTPRLTSDYDERTRLNAARMGWSMVGGIVAGVGMPILMGFGGFRLAGASLAVLIVPGLAITWAVTRGRVRGAHEAVGGAISPPWEVLRSLPFRRVALLFLAAWSSVSVLSALVPFYVTHHLHAPEKLDALFAAIQLSALASIPGIAWLAARVQKHLAYAAAMGSWAFVLLALAAIPEGAATPAIAVALLAGPGVAAAHVLPWSMLPDVVDVDRAERGADRTGDFYGMMTFLEQVGTAVALWGLGQSLGASGYVEGAATQSDAARAAIATMIGPVPAVILCGAGVFAWLRPPLTREAHRAALARMGG